MMGEHHDYDYDYDGRTPIMIVTANGKKVC